jgi:hypothetical protein
LGFFRARVLVVAEGLKRKGDSFFWGKLQEKEKMKGF